MLKEYFLNPLKLVLTANTGFCLINKILLIKWRNKFETFMPDYVFKLKFLTQEQVLVWETNICDLVKK